MSEYIVRGAVPNHTVRVEDEREVIWRMTHLPVLEEVVRCRDCECFAVDQSDHEYRSGWWCHRWDTDMVKPDGFCAWGERRDA